MLFPDGANVELVRLTGERSAQMSVYERGSGPTRSCGTGAVAAAVAAAHAAGEPEGAWAIRVPGGDLTVTLTPQTTLLTGPAVIVAEGQLTPAWLARLTRAAPAFNARAPSVLPGPPGPESSCSGPGDGSSKVTSTCSKPLLRWALAWREYTRRSPDVSDTSSVNGVSSALGCMSLTRMTLISVQSRTATAHHQADRPARPPGHTGANHVLRRHHRRGKRATAGRMSRQRRWLAELIKRRAFFGRRASRDR